MVLWSSLQEVSSHLCRVTISLLDRSLYIDFSGSIFSYSLGVWFTMMFTLECWGSAFDIAHLRSWCCKIALQTSLQSWLQLLCLRTGRARCRSCGISHLGLAYLTLASSSAQENFVIFLGGFSASSFFLASLYPRRTGSPPYMSPSPLKISAPSVLKFLGAWA